MSRSLDTRIARLEQSVQQAVPYLDWTKTEAYAALSAADREQLEAYVERFNESGLQPFTDEELSDFERILIPLAKEERDDAERL